MAVEQAENEGGSPEGSGTAASGTAAAAPAPAGDVAAKPELDDVKRKFREALDRKRQQHAHANADSTQETGKVQHAHGPASRRRSCRRTRGG